MLLAIRVKSPFSHRTLFGWIVSNMSESPSYENGVALSRSDEYERVPRTGHFLDGIKPWSGCAMHRFLHSNGHDNAGSKCQGRDQPNGCLQPESISRDA